MSGSEVARGHTDAVTALPGLPCRCTPYRCAWREAGAIAICVGGQWDDLIVTESVSRASQGDQRKQHWLPAGYLGGFSSDTDRPRLRDRRLWVLETGCDTPAVRVAKNLGYRVGLYDLEEEAPWTLSRDALDNTFAAYERRLPRTISELAASAGSIPFDVWMKVLVPFVAGLSVRAPEFAERVAGAMLQMSRWFEMSRVLAPLMAAEWYLLRTPPGSQLITNDRGFTWTKVGSRTGLIVPTNSNSALQIVPRNNRLIAGRATDGWRAPLLRMDLSSSDVDALNADISTAALYWIAAADKADVVGRQVDGITRNWPVFDGTWPPLGPLGTHDRDWMVALELAEVSFRPKDWHPGIAILASIEPGVRLVDRPEAGLFIEIQM
jgi:hypothetical protein